MTDAASLAPEGLFAVLEGADVLPRLERQTVARGTRLIAEGTHADAMYLVATGRFRVTKDGVDLAEIGAGGVLGEIAFFTGQLRTADVVAARDSVVCKITSDAYDALCKEKPGLPKAISAELARRLARTSARVVPDRGRPPARTFCILPCARAPLPGNFVPDLTAEVARHLTVTVVTEAGFREEMGPGADPASAEAIAWLNAQELTADVVFFVASPEASAW